jgi:two-component system chemotaxis response regulator CheB
MAPEFRIVVIGGAGPGGLDALRQLLSAMPVTVPALVLVALSHLPATTTAVQAQVAGCTRLNVLLAHDGDTAKPRHIYLGVPEHHILLEAGHRISLPFDAQAANRRPTADLLFMSAATFYGTRVIGVALSGSGGGSDGVAGLRAIKRAGGITMAQRPATAGNPGLPLHALPEDSPDFVAAPDELGLLLGYLLRSVPDAKRLE